MRFREGEAPAEPRSQGGRGSCRAALLPPQREQFSLIRPIIRVFDQSGTHWILTDILPFFIVTFSVTKSRIPMVGLPPDRFVRMFLSKLRLNVPNPCVKTQINIAWRCEAVKMIGHNHIATKMPCSCAPANRTKEGMIEFGCKPTRSFFSANRNEHDCWLAVEL